MKKLINKKFNLPILVIFLVGVVVGIIFLFFISDVDKLVIESEINNYLELIGSNSINKLNAFFNSFKNNLMYLTVIWASSITLIFSPISLFIVFYKGFLNGFMLSSFIMVFGIKGFVYGCLFMFPHEIINVVIFLIFTIIMLSISFKLLKSIYLNGTVNLRIFFKKILVVYLIGVTSIIVTSLLEVFVNSMLLDFFF